MNVAVETIMALLSPSLALPRKTGEGRI